VWENAEIGGVGSCFAQPYGQPTVDLMVATSRSALNVPDGASLLAPSASPTVPFELR
jgi:hypothetical protein